MKKGISETIIGILILLLVVGGFLYAKTYNPSCTFDSYNPNCTCPEGYKKVYMPWHGKDRWTCEKIENLILDPDSPTLEQDAIEFTKNYLSTYCRDICTDFNCGTKCGKGIVPIDGDNKCINSIYGYGAGDKSFELTVNVECRVINEWSDRGISCNSNSDCGEWEWCYKGECRLPSSGFSPWRMEFLIESDAGNPVTLDIMKQNNYCYNTDTNKKCTLPEVCEEYGNPDWCIPNLPLEVID